MASQRIPVLPCATFLPDPECPIGVRRNIRHGAVNLHAHEFVELVLIRGGLASHFSPDREVQIHAGDVFVIHTDQAHGYRAPHDLDLVNVMFLADVLPADEPTLSRMPGYRALFDHDPAEHAKQGFGVHLRLTPSAHLRVNATIDAIDREMTARAAGFRPLVRGLFAQLVITLSRLYRDGTRPPETAVLELAGTLDHIRRHFDKDLRLDDLATRAGMSVSTLLRRFRVATGTSPVEFLIKLRIERAREILSMTDQRVTDIAFATGFRDSNYFTRQFNRHTGLSPRAYRQSLRYLNPD